MTPQGADFVLASEDPHSETQVLVRNGYHTETARLKGRDHIAKLHLIMDRGHTNCIKHDQRDPHAGTAFFDEKRHRLVHSEETVRVRQRVVLASGLVTRNSSQRECTTMSPNKTTIQATGNAHTSASITGAGWSASPIRSPRRQWKSQM